MRYKINKLFLVVSIILGLLIGVVNEFTIYGYRYLLPGVLTVAGCLGVFGLISAIVLIIRGNVTNSYARAGKMIGLGLLMLLLFIGSSALFDFIYEQDMDFSVAKEEKMEGRYVFLIDDSGSMQKDLEYGAISVNDPNGTRFDVVEDIIKKLSDKSEFAVYMFADDTVCITPMGSVKPSEYTLDVETQGGQTYMVTAVDDVIDEIGDPDKPTVIYLLTDGAPMDDFLADDTIERCNENNVTVNGIGFGAPDESFMRKFTEGTNGTYTDAGDVSNLATTMNTVVDIPEMTEDGDLLGLHKGAGLFGADILHIILRILFLVLLALIWTVAKQLFIGDLKYAKALAVTTFIIGAVAAVLFEIMMLMPIPYIDSLARLMLYGAWGLTLVPEFLDKKTPGTDLGGFETGKRSIASDFGQEFGSSGDANSFI